jgi:hypothetical protein
MSVPSTRACARQSVETIEGFPQMEEHDRRGSGVTLQA